jgi:uncharacterized membrane protein
MNEWFVLISEHAITFINAIALVVIVFGTLEAVVRIVPLVLGNHPDPAGRDIWLRYARWLIAGLTFQLASDLVETSISTHWETVARVGAVAVIRTFLDYFLGRDVNEIRERQRERGQSHGAGSDPSR